MKIWKVTRTSSTAGTYRSGGRRKLEPPRATRAIQRRSKGSSARHQPRSRKLAERLSRRTSSWEISCAGKAPSAEQR